MSYVQSISQAIYTNRKVGIRMLGSAITLCLFLYAYLVVGIIFNGSTIEYIERKISQESSELSDLESRYIALKNSISIDVAHNLGFVEAPDPIYLARDIRDSVALGN